MSTLLSAHNKVRSMQLVHDKEFVDPGIAIAK